MSTSVRCKGLSSTVGCVLTHLGSGGFTWLQPDRGGVRGGGGVRFMLTFYLWAIRIGQLAFAGNDHWLVTMLLSSSG